MSMSEYQEHIEAPAEAITDEEIANLIDHGGEAPSYHTILQVWREVLSNAVDQRDDKVTPQWANRMVQSYAGVTFADTVTLHRGMFDLLMEFASVLESVIESDDEALNYTTPEEDAEHNSRHYKDLLIHWQILLLGREIAWDAAAPDAAVDLAVISEVHRMVFGPEGVTAFLDNIGFQYTEADQAELREALETVREGR